ncbi:MAG: alpha/beta hydrolase [Betaproteobacteria bacterium]|nr:alpha/beta hydrolase [Betaproteobacteria bacterium]
MNTLHPQVAAFLEVVRNSKIPPMHRVNALEARNIYRDTRGKLLPTAPPMALCEDISVPGPAGSITVRHYRPAGSATSETLPALVFFHGGGWVIGDLDTHDVLCRELSNGARCAVFAVHYRLAPEHRFPAAVDDSIAATRHIAQRAADYGIAAARIAVGGDSAGGNLATVVALAARDAGGPRLVYQLLIYPGTDQRMLHASHNANGAGYLLTRELIEYFRGHYLPDAKQYDDWRASPLLAKDLSGLPPAYVLTAGFDPLVDEGKEYADRLAAAGVAVEYRCYEDMVHGFIIMGGVLDTARAAVADCAERLKRGLG